MNAYTYSSSCSAVGILCNLDSNTRRLLSSSSSSSSSNCCLNNPTNNYSSGITGFAIKKYKKRANVKASCSFDPTNQPILKEVLKEPVAFLGGMFAGILRLDLEEEPLKEWVTRTVEASGIEVEDINAEGSISEEEPQQIEIE